MTEEIKNNDQKEMTLSKVAQSPIFKQLRVFIFTAIATILAAIAIFVLKEPSFRPLATSLNDQGMTQIVDILEKDNYQNFEVDTSRGAVLVASKDVNKLRLLLAQNNFKNGDSSGWSLFNEDRPLGTTKFRESVAYTRAKEGEIEHSIESIHAVSEANVNLAIQEKSSFLNQNSSSSASVTLHIKDGYRLSKKQIRAIKNLVASAVENLDPDSVTIVDQNLDYLSTEQDPKYDDEQLTFKANIEKQFAKKIVNMLSPIVGGETKVRANITAEIDFNSVEQTSEKYLPEDSVLRSEQTMESEENSIVDGGVPGALTDTPPAAVTATEFDIQKQEQSTVPLRKRKENTSNYEVGRLYEHSKKASGMIVRLSAAVLIDNVATKDEEGNLIKTPFNDELIAKIEELSKTAIGFSQERGDVITVLNAQFADRHVKQMVEPPFYKSSLFVEYVTKFIVGIVIVIVMLILRSMISRQMTEIEDNTEEKFQERIKELTPQQEQIELDERTEEQQFEQELNNVINTVATDPDVTVQVFREWVKDDMPTESSAELFE